MTLSHELWHFLSLSGTLAFFDIFFGTHCNILSGTSALTETLSPSMESWHSLTLSLELKHYQTLSLELGHSLTLTLTLSESENQIFIYRKSLKMQKKKEKKVIEL